MIVWFVPATGAPPMYTVDAVVVVTEVTNPLALTVMTGTVVEVQSTLEITASEPVIKALLAIAPMAKGKRKTGNRYTKATEIGEPASEPESDPAY